MKTRPIQTHEPFVAHLVKEPPANHSHVDMLSALPSEYRHYYEDGSKMIPPEESWPSDHIEVSKRYDKVMGPPDEWIKYLRRPEVRQLWTLAPSAEARATLTVAAVPKKTPPDLRKILMIVPFNYIAFSVESMLGTRFDYGLLGGTAISQIQADDDDFSVVALDQANAFTYIQAPEYWWPFQAGPEVAAGDLPDDWVAGRWASHVRLRPQYTRLAMGGTHSVFVLMVINMARVRRVLATNSRFAGCVLLNEARVRARRWILKHGFALVYVHLDDVAVIGRDRAFCNELRAALKASLEELNFIITEEEPMEGSCRNGVKSMHQQGTGERRWW